MIATSCLKRAITILAGTILPAISVPAFAQALSATVYAPGDGSPNSLTFTIPVKASVGGVCGFASAPSGSYDADQIDVNTWSKDFPFTLMCTVPSRVAVTSLNGGLRNPTSPGVPGYTNVAPYTVTLNIAGSTTSVSQACAVDTLSPSSATPCSFRGPANSSTGLRLNDTSVNATGSYVRVNAPAYSGSNMLISGNYADTLTVTVFAAP